MLENLIKNLKTEYGNFNLDDSFFEEAANYGIYNSKDEKVYPIELSKRYIDKYLVSQAKIDDSIKSLLIERYSNIKYRYAIKYKIGFKEIEDIYIKVMDNVINRYNSKLTIQENIKNNFVKIMEKKEIKSEKIVKNISSKHELENNKGMINDKDITFLRKWLNENNITMNSFSKFVGIDSSILYNYIVLGRPVKEYDSKKILSKFGYDDINMLYENINKLDIAKLNIEIRKTNSYMKSKNVEEISQSHENIDISFLNNIIKTKEDINELSKALGANTSSLTYWLMGKKKMPYYYLEKLLEYYKINSIDELKQKSIHKKTSKMQLESSNVLKEQAATSETSLNNDVSFLKEYLKYAKISKSRFAKDLGISPVTLDKWLNGQKIMKNNLDKILNYFNVKDIDGLKRYITYHIDRIKKEEEKKKRQKEEESRLYDISFLKEYLKYVKISKSKLSKDLGISPVTLDKWLNGQKIKKNNLDKILIYFNAKSIESLMQYTKYQIEKIKQIIIEEEEQKKRQKEEESKLYDISFLKEYLKYVKISKSKLSKDLGISPVTLDKWLNGQKIKKNNLDKILIYFNAKSIESLMQYTKYQIEKIKQIIIEEEEQKKRQKEEESKLYDISFLKEYLKYIKISKSKLSKDLGISPVTLNRWLNGKLISKKKLELILNYFNLDNYVELKDFVENNVKFFHDSYDVTFLKEYLKLKKISQAYFAHEVKVSPITINRYLNGLKNPSYTDICKILKYFDVNTYEELLNKVENELKYIYEQIEKGEVDIKKKKKSKNNWVKLTDKQIEEEFKDNNYNIQFLNEYLRKNNILINDLSIHTGICTSNLYNYIVKGKGIRESDLNKILRVFNVNTYQELKDNIDFIKLDFAKPTTNKNLNILDENNRSYSNTNWYDIAFLKSYLLFSKIKIKNISNYIGVNQNTINNWLTGKNKVSSKNMKLLFEFFEVNNIDELKQLVNQELEKQKILDPNLSNDKYDITFLNEYIVKNKIKKPLIASALGITQATLYFWLSGEKMMSRKYLSDLLNYFNCININELKEKTSCFIAKPIDNISLNKSEYSNNGKNNLMQGDIKTISATDCEKNILEVVKLININILNQILINYNISKDEFYAVQLLFGGVKNKYYSLNEVERITSFSKKKILEIFKYCLKIYNDSFESKIEAEFMYILQNSKM